MKHCHFDPAFLQDLTELLLRRNPLLLADADEHGLVPYVRRWLLLFGTPPPAVQWAGRVWALCVGAVCAIMCVDSRQAASLW